MPVAAKPRAKHRRRRRDEDDADSHEGSHSDSQSESGNSESEASVASEDDEPGVEEDEEEPVAVSFDEFAKETVETTVEEQQTEHVDQSTNVEKPAATDAAPRPRPASNRAAYLAKLSSDPTFVPRVGKFWTHDQRHFGGGKVGQGDYAGLREMSEYWRERGRGRGRGRGFARGRGGVRPQERPQNEGKDTKSETVKPREKDTSTVPVDEANTPATAPLNAPAAAATSKSSWNGDVGRSERGSWSHDGYAELAREEERRSAARQAAVARGRGGRGMVRGMFRGRGRGAFPVPAARPESVDTSAPIEETETTAAPVVKLPESTFIPPTSDHEPSAITAHLQTQAEHAERLQQQELAKKEQQALEDDMKRLEIGQQRVQSLGASSDAGSSSQQHQPPTLLPPGIGMTESGAFFDIVTGQAVVWVPSPSPGPMAGPPASFGTAMNSRMGYNPYAPSPEMGMGYGYPPQYGYQAPYAGYPRPHDPYYQPSFNTGRDSVSPYPMPGYNMPPPQLADPTYFIPPRPQSKIQIRAPISGDAPSRGHRQSADIAAATLKDPSKHGARSPEQAQGNAYGYQPMMNAPYMQHAQQGYYPQQYMPMGY